MFSQQDGDYRSVKSGDFEDVTVWEVYGSGSWAQATLTPFEALPPNLKISNTHDIALNSPFISPSTQFVSEGIFDPNGYNLSLMNINFLGIAVVSDDFGSLELVSGLSSLPKCQMSNLTIHQDVTLTLNGPTYTKDVFLYGKIVVMPDVLFKTFETRFYENQSLLMRSIDEDDACSFFPASIWYDAGINNPITIERVMDGYEGVIGDQPWHSVAIPVETAVSGAFVDFYLKYFDEGAGQFEQVDPEPSTLNVPLYPGVGYFAMFADPGLRTVEFSGKPNNNDSYVIDVTADGSGYNLVGNPYPCALDIISIQRSGGSNTPISNIVWVWDSEAGNYVTRDISGDVPPENMVSANQSFFVKTTIAASITIPKEARMDSIFGFLKEKTVSPECLGLTVSDNSNRSDQTWIAFRDNASYEFDEHYDGKKITGNSASPQFFTYIDDSKISVNVMPKSDSRVVEYGFVKGSVSSEYTITASNLDGFGSDLGLILIDKKLDYQQNLKENSSYTFISEDGDEENRFSVMFDRTDVLSFNSNEDLTIYVHDNVLFVETEEILNGELSVYNMLGQKVFEKEWNSNQQSLSLPLEKGCYVVSIVGDKVRCSQKVIID